MQERDYSNVLEVGAYALGSTGLAAGHCFHCSHPGKLSYSNIPGPMRGLGISFIITGLMGIAFMSFMGIKF